MSNAIDAVSSPVVDKHVPIPRSDIRVVKRASKERGYSNLGWLDSYHTFSFADYYDASYQGFGPLRVINEDRVQPGRGFGRHPHRDFEIFSYVVQGSLKHDDSLGHSESISRGQVQFTSAGTGIQHAEANHSAKDLVHFLQIWVKPRVNGLKPSYTTATFTDEQKLKDWTLIVSPESDERAHGSITVHADCRMYAGLLRHNEHRSFTARPGHALYVHVVSDIQGMHGTEALTQLCIKDTDTDLTSGDGAFITFQGNAKGKSNTIMFAGKHVKGANAAVEERKEGVNDQSSSSSHLKPTEVLLFELKL